MPNYLRSHVLGGTYFFTLVTQDRRPILTSPLARHCLRRSIRQELRTTLFELVAIVLLPDHLHAIWTLPEGDTDYSMRWKRIKERFTREYLAAGGSEGTKTAARVAKQERGVWQRRFWEHTVRDEEDLESCFNYLHYNPVKHGQVKRVCDYAWSTFHRYVKLGWYPADWGCSPNEIPAASGAEWD